MQSKDMEINMADNYLSKTDSFFTERMTSTNWTMNDCHFHDGYEIYMSLTDGVQFFVNDKVYPVNRGDILIFNHLDLHRALIPPQIEYNRCYIIFSPNYIDNFSTEQTNLLDCFEHDKRTFSYCIHLGEEELDVFCKLFGDCERYGTESFSYGYDVQKMISLINLLIFVNKVYENSNQINHSLRSGHAHRVRNIQKFIAANLSAELSLDALAKEFYLSKRHLEHIFKEYCGFSVGEYITNVRIIKARELLQQGLSVSLVGDRVGYHNLSHFSRVFKQHTGISPKKYAG